MNKKIPILVGIAILLFSGIAGIFAALRTPGAPSPQNFENKQAQKATSQANSSTYPQKNTDIPSPTKSTKAS